MANMASSNVNSRTSSNWPVSLNELEDWKKTPKTNPIKQPSNQISKAEAW